MTGAGVTFRLSGYRAINGRALKPISEDIELGNGALTLPTTLPFSFVTGVGYDWRSEERTSSGGSAGGLAAGTKTTQKASSLALEDASIFLTGSFGKHLSAFVEFPMYETKAWEFTPTGPAEANSAPGSSATGGRQFQFNAENPTFEVAKFWWNDLFESAPPNSVNVLGGITHLPLAYPSGKVRLSVNQFLIYERRALDLISPNAVSASIGAADESLFRLGEPQILLELNGILTFGKPLTDTGKRETFWNEYHIGISNGSNGKPDNNTTKDFYARYVMRWLNQTLGFFGYYSADTYDDQFRAANAVGGTNLAIMSGAQSANKMSRTGLDFTLSAVPFGIPVSLDNQFMWNSESNPTGFDQKFNWKGGFNQLNWLVSRSDVLYARYDWIKGDAFNDTNSTVNGNTGITLSTPKENDVVAGYQHLIQQNVKFILELRRHEFQDTARPTTAKLVDNGGTARVMIGF